MQIDNLSGSIFAPPEHTAGRARIICRLGRPGPLPSEALGSRCFCTELRAAGVGFRRDIVSSLQDTHTVVAGGVMSCFHRSCADAILIPVLPPCMRVVLGLFQERAMVLSRVPLMRRL